MLQKRGDLHTPLQTPDGMILLNSPYLREFVSLSENKQKMYGYRSGYTKVVKSLGEQGIEYETKDGNWHFDARANLFLVRVIPRNYLLLESRTPENRELEWNMFMFTGDISLTSPTEQKTLPINYAVLTEEFPFDDYLLHRAVFGERTEIVEQRAYAILSGYREQLKLALRAKEKKVKKKTHHGRYSRPPAQIPYDPAFTRPGLRF